MNRARIERTVKRMAWQIAEVVRGKPLVLIGLDRAGSILSQRTAAILEKASFESSIRRYELDTDHPEQLPDVTSESNDLSETVLILFSDVIFTGETIYTILRQLPITETAETHVAVLVDRGHRTLPVAPKFTGLEIPTKSREVIEVLLGDDHEEVALLHL